jgi:hypothetical protein
MDPAIMVDCVLFLDQLTRAPLNKVSSLRNGNPTFECEGSQRSKCMYMVMVVTSTFVILPSRDKVGEETGAQWMGMHSAGGCAYLAHR